MLASGGLSAGTVFPEAWELDVPDGTDPASFWCAFDRSGETLHVKMDQSRRRDREGCVLKVHWKKFVPFVGTNQVWRLTCRQSASQPMGRNAPEIRLSDHGVECFRYQPTSVSVVGDRTVATYQFLPEDHVGTTWGFEPNGVFDGPMSLCEIHIPCQASGEVWLESFVPESEGPVVNCREHAMTFVPDADPYWLAWDDEGRAVYTNGILEITATKAQCYLKYGRGSPGPKPFHGPLALRLQTGGGPTGGVVCVELKNRDNGRKVKVESPWTDRTLFRFDLPASEYWQFETIRFDTKAKGPMAPFRVLALESVSREPPAAAIRLDVDTGNPLHVTVDSSLVALTLRNAAKETVAFTGMLHLTGYFGDKLDVPVKGELKGGETLRVPVDVARAQPGGAARIHGIWRVAGEVRSQGTVAYPETRFAVLNRNEVTPRLPFGKFRMGINYHMDSYKGLHRKLTLDALNACGAKLVRSAGFAASYCWRKPDKLDFSNADRQMSELKARGLSLNTDCWPNPKWMVKPEQLKLGYPGWIRVRTMPGVMGEYAEKLAAHFGTDIDYIETSNEADLWGNGAMSAEEYVEYQKEVYAGVKRGCQAIRVLTSAWAFADSSAPAVKRKGFQEAVLEKAKGFYDIHPTHQHSGFAAYENDVLSKFLPMRERLGVTVPWYANETALTSVNGAEDGVAKNVWMKILFSWAHGSTDYIWYNLRGTGWRPADPEQGYGLLTADYYPRAGYAAFSALAHVTGGLDFDGIVSERKGRHLYRFRGERAGRPVRVLAGWDGFTDPPFPIRVRTDAVRARVVDMMGNFTEAERTDGGFVFPISLNPGVLVLDGATFADPVATDADNVPPPKVDARACVAAIEGRAPDFILDRVWNVRQLYAANPETVDRTWKGPSDLSVRIWIGRTDADLRIRFEVTDDRHVQRFPSERLYLGDGLQFILEAPGQSGNFEFGLAMDGDGKPLTHTWIVPTGFEAAKVNGALRLVPSREGNRTVYDAYLPLQAIGFDAETLANGFRFNCIVYDDDGRGENRDNWIEIVPGIAGQKDYSKAPYVKILNPNRTTKSE